MSRRQEFEMSEQDRVEMLAAIRAHPYIVANGVPPMSQRESANLAWQRLGKKMGFIWDSAQPVRGKSDRFFSAVPLFEDGEPQEDAESQSVQAEARLEGER